jgi:DNA-binding HxlR family transcriptional regulator
MSEVRKVCVRFRTAIELLGGRWTGAVLKALLTGSHRFADIKAAVPKLSDTMLSQRLRELEAAGLVERHVLATSPVRVEYQLTEMGRDVDPILDAVIAWSHRWIPLPADDEDDSAARRERPREVLKVIEAPHADTLLPCSRATSTPTRPDSP